jgi:hypothetical protein
MLDGKQPIVPFRLGELLQYLLDAESLLGDYTFLQRHTGLPGHTDCEWGLAEQASHTVQVQPLDDRVHTGTRSEGNQQDEEVKVYTCVVKGSTA